MDTTIAEARRRDAADPLRHLAERFVRPENRIYLDGNSLGLAPRAAPAAVERVLGEWRDLAIDGFMRASPPWYTFGESLAPLVAPLVGAQPSSVAVTGTTTWNLHTLVATLYRPAGARRRIVATAVDFPSDVYALRSQIALHGGAPDVELVRVPARPDGLVHESDVEAALDDRVALALLPSVLYHTGQLLDVGRLASACASRGVALGIDAAHGVGSVPHHLERWGVDFAVWCGYKYLCGGPACPAGLFVHPRHHDRLPGLAGWWGSDKDRQFDMSHEFTPAAGAGRWQVSAPSPLALAPLAAALDVFAEVGIEAVRDASLSRTAYLLDLLDAAALTGGHDGFEIATPRDPGRRGGHVALRHPDAVRIARALKQRGVVPDFRPPDIVRLAPVALYNSYEDVWRAVEHLCELLAAGDHEALAPRRDLVG